MRAANETETDYRWDLWSRHGGVILYLVAYPGSSIQQIADGLETSQRTIRDIIADLRRAGMLTVMPCGRRLTYFVDLDAPFRHPTITGVTLRCLLGAIAQSTSPPGTPDPALSR